MSPQTFCTFPLLPVMDFFFYGVIKSMAIYFSWDEVRVPGSEI